MDKTKMKKLLLGAVLLLAGCAQAARSGEEADPISPPSTTPPMVAQDLRPTAPDMAPSEEPEDLRNADFRFPAVDLRPADDMRSTDLRSVIGDPNTDE